jgi:hypothetical protein
MAARWIGSAGTGSGGLLSWIERGDGDEVLLRYRMTSVEGFGPVSTAIRFDDGFVNWADVPALARFGTGATGGSVGSEDDQPGPPQFLAARLRMLGEGTYAYGVSTSISRDGGATWEEPVWLHGDRSETEHGFVTLTPLGDGGVQAFWLDGRKMLKGGPMTVRTRRLSAAGVWGEEQEVDDRACDCCPTAAVRVGKDRVLVAWRDRTQSEVRDISFSLGTPDGEGQLQWSMPKTVHDDGWKIAGCPVNGPALAARDDRIAAAWFTMGRNQRPRVLLAVSHDGGESFGKPEAIDSGSPMGRVDLVYLPDGRLAVSWLEQVGEAAEWRLRVVDREGSVGEARTLTEVPAERSSGFVRLVPMGGDVSLVWTRQGRGLGVMSLGLSE